LEAGFLVVVVGLDAIFKFRLFPWIIPVWLAGILVFWLLARQQLDLLWPFIKNSWRVANGYTNAMNEGHLFTLIPLVFVLIAMGLCVLGTMLFPSPRRKYAVLFLAGMGGILFLNKAS